MTLREAVGWLGYAARTREGRRGQQDFKSGRPQHSSDTCRIDEKIRKLEEQLVKHRDTIKKARPGPAQDAAKRRALGVSYLPIP